MQVGEIDRLVDAVGDHEHGLGVGLAAPELDALLLEVGAPASPLTWHRIELDSEARTGSSGHPG
jgi:hypothetical protein